MQIGLRMALRQVEKFEQIVVLNLSRQWCGRFVPRIPNPLLRHQKHRPSSHPAAFHAAPAAFRRIALAAIRGERHSPPHTNQELLMNETHTESALQHKCRERRRHGMFGPAVLIVVGAVLLAYKSNLLPREVIHQWWPLGLIALGVGLALARARR
jgi:hypothetical protein